MNVKLEFLQKMIKAYHIECIRKIVTQENIKDDVRMLLINKHINWLKQTDVAYNYAGTIDKVRELIKKK